MHSILFSLQKPTDAAPAKMSDWTTAVKTVENSVNNLSTVQPLGQGAWLLTGPDAMPLLGIQLRAAADWKVPYRILFVQDATDWTPDTPV